VVSSASRPAFGRLRAAVAGAPVVVLAIPGSAVRDLASNLGVGLDGKIVIDASNDVAGASLNGYAAITAAAATAFYFRAFNTVGWENFANPRYGVINADLFYTGPSGVQRDAVEQLIDDVGLRPVYVGDNDQIAIVDGLTKLWFALAFNQGRGRGIAFKLLER
jgi:predicted dinucleotide-binding enzyme